MMSALPASAGSVISEDTPDDGRYLLDDEPAVYAAGFRLKGTLRSVSTRVPGAGAAGRDLAAVAGTGEAWSQPLRFAGQVEHGAGRISIRDAFLEAGTPTFSVRIGDGFQAVDGFRNQAETRRGVALRYARGPLAWNALASPAGLAGSSPGGGAPGSLYGAGVRLAGPAASVTAGGFHGDDSRARDGAPARRQIAHLGGDVRSGTGAVLAATGAISRSADTLGTAQAGGAVRVEARNRWRHLQGGATWERADRGYRALGAAGGYAGGDWIEVAQRVSRFERVQPYARWRTARVVPLDSGLASNQPRGELLVTGALFGLGRGRTLDVSSRDERLSAAARRRGYLVQASGSLGGEFSGLLILDQESSTGAPWNVTTRHAQAGVTYATRAHTLLRIYTDLHATDGGHAGGHSSGFAHGLEGYVMSLTEQYRLRGSVVLRTGTAPGPARPLRGLDLGLACGGRWHGFDVEPEARLVRLDWRTGAAAPEFSATLRISQTFSLRAFPQRAEVTGRVFEDSNGNDVFDPDERTVAGAALLLDGDRRALSDMDGRFTFSNLPEGVYRLAADPWDLPVGLRPASDRPAVLTLIRGTTEVDVAVLPEGAR